MLEYEGMMHADDDIVAVGYVALSGTVKAAGAKEDLLKTRFAPSYVKRCQNLDKFYVTELTEDKAVSSYCKVGEGGIYKALWDYFKESKLGFEIELRDLPFKQETIEVCEVVDFNPYRLESEGLILYTTAHGRKFASGLKKAGVPATVIGRVTKAIGKRLLNGEIETFLDRPQPDELTKLLG